MSLQNIKNAIRNVPDFPKPGIQFKDITTALQKADIFHEIVQNFYQHYKDKKIDYIVGIESRGFIIGAALAYVLKCGFVPVRKPGKLPAETISQEYTLEYGVDKLEIHRDALSANAKVLIVDDLLATGGTAEAAALLVQKAGAKVSGFAFMVELNELQGRKKLQNIADTYCLITY